MRFLYNISTILGGTPRFGAMQNFIQIYEDYPMRR
jgi:hypothetical protein